jgi:hypothetical protein
VIAREPHAETGQASGTESEPDVARQRWDVDGKVEGVSERAKDWDCEAYGPDLPSELGHLCFYDEIEPCASQAQCHTRMAGERQRVFRRINELAAAGDPTGQLLADEFTNPSQLLNADEEPDGATGGVAGDL